MNNEQSTANSKRPLLLLNVYAGQDPEPEANPLQAMFPDAIVTTAPIEKVLPWEFIEQYDIVYCAHVLTLVEAKDIPATVKKLAAILADRGELWITAPSLEWAAREIESENPNPALHTALFGDADHPARSGFTLGWLRQLMENTGLIPRRAYHGVYRVMLKEQAIEIPLAVCVGWKVN